MSIRSVAALLAVALLASPPLARAQATEPASFPVERLRPAVDREGILDVEWGGVGPHGSYDLALWSTYALNPLTLARPLPGGGQERVGVLVGHRLGASLVGAISLFDWIEIGGEIPVVLFQSRGGGVPTAEAVLKDLSVVGLGDIRVVPKIRLLRAEEAFVDVALIPAFTLPTGFPFQSYMGEGFFTAVPEVAVSREILGLRLAGNLAARFRPETRFLTLQVTHELVWRLGAGYRFAETAAKLPLEVHASLNGATAAAAPFSSINQNPVELLAGASYEALPGMLQVFGGAGVGLLAGFGTPDLRLFAGVRFSPRERDRDGDGILDDQDACPDQAEDQDGFEDSDGCPDLDNDADGVPDMEDRCRDVPGVPEEQGCPLGDSDGDGILDDVDLCKDEPEDKDGYADQDGCPDLDNDGDGVADGSDGCPAEPEYKDGYADQDGCPEPDNDTDGILDPADQCPDEPEDVDGEKDEDGCPDATRIVVTKQKVFALEKIFFDTGKASIKAGSYPMLDEVARVLKENPEIAKIRIEGHTDAQGSDDFNLKLSQDRADSVRRYLVERGGVAPDRLEAVGYGETRPIADNDTPEGREKNRRVEFLILGAGE